METMRTGRIEVSLTELNISQFFDVNILPINDIPILGEIDEMNINEDESETISLSATDVDYVSFDYTANSSSNDINTSINGNLLTLTGDANSFGSGMITVTVADNEGAEDSQDVLFSILPINDPPVLGELSEVSISEDSLSVFSNVISD